MYIKNRLAIVPVVLFSIIYSMTIWPYELGVGPDSVAYIRAAYLILTDFGYPVHDMFWPPLYPYVLAFSMKVSGLDILTSGKILHTLLFLAFGILLVKISEQLKFHRTLVYVLPSTILAAASIKYFVCFLSELLCVVLIMFFLYFILKYIEDRKNTSIVCAGTIGVLLMLTRYPAFSFVLSAVLFFATEKKTKSSKKMKNIAIFSAPIFVGYGLWLIYASYLSNKQSFSGMLHKRQLTFDYTGLDRFLSDTLSTIESWVIAGNMAYVCFLFFLLSTISIIIYKFKYFLKDIRFKTEEILLLLNFAFIYYIFYLFCKIFIDVTIPMGIRPLSLILPMVFFLVGYVMNYILRNNPVFLSYPVVLSMSASVCLSSAHIWKSHYVNGSLYTGSEFSKIKDFIIKNYADKKDLKVYSNRPYLLTFYLNYTSTIGKHIPMKNWASIENSYYHEEVQAMNNEINDGKAHLLIFVISGYDKNALNLPEVKGIMSEYKVLTFEGGRIIQIKNQN